MTKFVKISLFGLLTLTAAHYTAAMQDTLQLPELPNNNQSRVLTLPLTKNTAPEDDAFAILPDELLHQVFSHLSANATMKMMRISRSTLKRCYLFDEKFAEHMIDVIKGPQFTGTSSEKLRAKFEQFFSSLYVADVTKARLLAGMAARRNLPENEITAHRDQFVKYLQEKERKTGVGQAFYHLERSKLSHCAKLFNPQGPKDITQKAQDLPQKFEDIMNAMTHDSLEQGYLFASINNSLQAFGISLHYGYNPYTASHQFFEGILLYQQEKESTNTGLKQFNIPHWILPKHKPTLAKLQEVIRLRWDDNKIYYSFLEDGLSAQKETQMLSVKDLINKGVNLKLAKVPSGHSDTLTPFEYFIQIPDHTYLKEALELGIDPNQLGLTQQTPLGLACERLNLQAVRFLLQAGADPNRKHPSSKQSLFENFCAQRHDRDGEKYKTWKEIIKLLIAYGTYFKGIIHKDGAQMTYFGWAIMNGDYDLVECFIKHGAPVNAPCKCVHDKTDNECLYTTPLGIASQGGHKQIKELLKKYGAKSL